MRADTAPEENPFISMQYLKYKTMSGANWSPTFASWLISSGNGVYLQPRQIAPEFWCQSTTACGVA
jgi:hypothetical protein